MGKKRWVNVELRQTLWNVESELRGLQDIEFKAPELMDEWRKGRRDELTKQLPKLRNQYDLCGGDGGIPDKGQAATDMRGWELLYMPDTPDEATAIHKALSSEPAPAMATPATPAPAADGAMMAAANRADIGGAVVERQTGKAMGISELDACRTIVKMENTHDDFLPPKDLGKWKNNFHRSATYNKTLPAPVFHRGQTAYYPPAALFEAMAKWEPAIIPAAAVEAARVCGFIVSQN